MLVRWSIRQQLQTLKGRGVWPCFGRCESQQTSLGGIDNGAAWTVQRSEAKERSAACQSGSLKCEMVMTAWDLEDELLIVLLHPLPLYP